MKSINKLLIGIVTVAGVSAASAASINWNANAFALGPVDITVFDNVADQPPVANSWFGGTLDSRISVGYGDPAGTSVYLGVRDDQEVEPGMSTGQNWDLEGFRFRVDGSGNVFLQVVGGYNYALGADGFMPGDIFVDVNGDALQSKTTPRPANGYADIASSSYKWDYAIHFSSFASGNAGTGGIQDGTAYTIYNIAGQTLLSTYYSGQGNRTDNPNYNLMSDPFRLKVPTQAASVANGNASVWKSLTDGQTGYLGDVNQVASHYALEVNITSLFNLLSLQVNGKNVYDGLGFHMTQGCGNDNLLGWYANPNIELPDGGMTLMLMGMGLSGIMFFARRNQKA